MELIIAILIISTVVILAAWLFLHDLFSPDGVMAKFVVLYLFFFIVAVAISWSIQVIGRHFIG